MLEDIKDEVNKFLNLISRKERKSNQHIQGCAYALRASVNDCLCVDKKNKEFEPWKYLSINTFKEKNNQTDEVN